MDLLPLALWWLLIIGMTGFGVFTIGLALITWAVEREEAKK